MITARSLIPVGLFVAFSVAHYMATKGNQSRVQLLVVADPGSVREPFTADLTATVSILVDDPTAEWLKPFLQPDDLGLVVGNTLKRPLQPGHLLQHRDFRDLQPGLKLLPPGMRGIQIHVPRADFDSGRVYVGQEVSFVIQKMDADRVLSSSVTGPFQVMAIGTESEPGPDREVPTSRNDRQQIVVAAKIMDDGTLDPKVDELLLASENSNDLRIAALALMPQEGQ